MPYVYRRPFDYPQHRQAFNLWQIAANQQAATASASFTTFAATLTVTAGEDTQYSRSVRFSTQGIYRRRWSYAVERSKINLFYTDAQEIFPAAISGAFTTYAARVQLGAVSGSTVDAEAASAALTTYPATVTGGRRDPLSDDVGTFTAYPAAITGTRGLGESRVGQVPAKGSGNYIPGRISVKGRSGRKRGPVREIVKLKR